MEKNLTVIESSNVLTMSSLEIAELTGKRHDNVMADIIKMLKELGIHSPVFAGTYKTARGNEYQCYHLPKDETLCLVSGYNVQMRMAIIKRWQELENQQVKQPTPQIAPPLEADIRCIGVIAEVMRLPDSGKLGMIRSYCQENAPRIVPVLPAYAIDAPIVAGTASSGSSEETAPITKIVASITSATKANQALHCAGLLEQKTRLSRSGEEKRYWCVTELGLKYGKNVTHPSCPLETQPHWYVKKANEIIDIVKANL